MVDNVKRTPFPKLSQRFVNDDGTMALPWQRLLVDLWRKSGAGNSIASIATYIALTPDGTGYAIYDANNGELLANLSGANNGPVSVADFGATGDGVTDDTLAIQQAHDYVEGKLGGTVALIAGAKHKCNAGLVWDPRLVALNGQGATLDFSSSVPSDIGNALLVGDDSNFYSSTGSWIFVNCSIALVAGGVELTNTLTGQAGYGYYVLPTVAGKWYVVKFVQQNGSGGAQMNMYAHIKVNNLAINYDTSTSDSWFLFQAKSDLTYLTMRVSLTDLGNSAVVGQIQCNVTTAPGLYVFDRSNQFANVVTAGSGYAVGQVLTVLGGNPITQAEITVQGIDAGGGITYAVVTNDGTYNVGEYPINPISVSGGSGGAATFNIGISTPQFGHEAYPMENFLLVGPGRNASYVVDAITPYELFSAPGAFFGILLNSPNLSANRNSTSSRGTLRNFLVRACTIGVAYNDQTYLHFCFDPGISNSNIGWLTLTGQNAGENNTVYAGWTTGCDINVCNHSQSLQMIAHSLDFPRQAQIRIIKQNAGLLLQFCHLEQSPPGLSTQLVAPIALQGDRNYLTLTGGDCLITGSYTRDSFPQIISTNNENQIVELSNVLLNNLKTEYLITGPARAYNSAPSRLLEFPSIPTLLNDQTEGNTAFDNFGYGDFETPVVGVGNKPQGLISLGSNMDNFNGTGLGSSFTQTYAGQWSTNRLDALLVNTQSHSGNQSLSIQKKTNNGSFARLYFLAPVRPGYQYWWTFWFNVPTPTGVPLNSTITMRQFYCQSGGVDTIPIGAPTGVSNQSLGFPFHLVGQLAPNRGQLFSSADPQPWATISLVNGTNGWVFCKTDVFNHGNSKSPQGATHVALLFDLTGFDGALWAAGPSCYFDEMRCWEI